jgi:hypothetical protein
MPQRHAPGGLHSSFQTGGRILVMADSSEKNGIRPLFRGTGEADDKACADGGEGPVPPRLRVL